MTRPPTSTARKFFRAVASIFAARPIIAASGNAGRAQRLIDYAVTNKAAISKSFAAWAAGGGSPFDLLAEDSPWTIVGRSVASKTYPDRTAFMREVIAPFNARLKKRLIPIVRQIYADEDTVIVLFDADALALDGGEYRNTYTRYLQMRDGRIVNATAFLDSIAFNDLWTRVTPAPGPQP
jgi:ketosteroid isomerase-like protein